MFRWKHKANLNPGERKLSPSAIIFADFKVTLNPASRSFILKAGIQILTEHEAVEIFSYLSTHLTMAITSISFQAFFTAVQSQNQVSSGGRFIFRIKKLITGLCIYTTNEHGTCSLLTDLVVSWIHGLDLYSIYICIYIYIYIYIIQL